MWSWCQPQQAIGDALTDEGFSAPHSIAAATSVPPDPRRSHANIKRFKPKEAQLEAKDQGGGTVTLRAIL
jgi:hypothetical protein